ncbi:NUDIX hydrolase [Streptomyces pilosus]|uniref:NUDIX hydrolase n=1 Tax=Streptomyces pilosus TaxID=28893 RepID=UPI00367A4D98
MGERVERVDEHDEVLAVVGRDDAVRHRWLHRIATVVCRDTAGRYLVHRRPDGAARFPGGYNWMLGGAVEPGESYEEAAARELAEELGVRAHPRFLLKFRCAGAISPYWLGLHETVVSGPLTPDPGEIAWHDWMTGDALAELVYHEEFVPDARAAFHRYLVTRYLVTVRGERPHHA